MKIVIGDAPAGRQAHLVLENREGTVKIPLDELEYVEVLNKKLSFHMAGGGLREVTGALADVEEGLLSRPEFVKTHRSYLVNLGCVQAMDAGSVVTKSGQRIPVSRQRRGPVRDAWLCFFRREGSGPVSGGAGAAVPAADGAGAGDAAAGKRPEGPWRILLVDDEPAECAFWADVLRGHGCVVSPVKSGGEALVLADEARFDCVLLDVMIPGEDGFSICKRLRGKTCAPVIFLSCVTESERQLEGFAAGGIDYITKDTPAELFWTKIKTRIRLSQPGERTQSVYGPLLLDLKKRKAYMDGGTVPLAPAEFDILWLLSEHADRVFLPEEIAETLWGREPLDKGQAVFHAMTGLVRKLERAWRGHRFIEAVWGEGYRFVPPDIGR